MKKKDLIVLIRGGGDVGSGVAVKLFNCGFPVVVTEIQEPLVVRRSIAFANCVYEGCCEIEKVSGKLVVNYDKIIESIASGTVPVIVDPDGLAIKKLKPDIVIDAVMAKRNILTKMNNANIVIGLGPGFTAGVDVDAVIETQSGHYLGRVIYNGKAADDTGIPCNIEGYTNERVFRAPCDGIIQNVVDIGDIVEKGQLLCRVNGVEVRSQLDGVVRGIIHDGLAVVKGLKLGDVDHRGDAQYNHYISDKIRNIAGGVLEAVLVLLQKKGYEI